MKRIITISICFIFVVFAFTGNIIFAQNKQKLIGISNLWVGNEVNRNLLKVIMDDLKAKEYKVISMNAEGDRDLQKKHVALFIDKKFDGIIIKGGVGGDFEELATRAYRNDIRLVGVEMYLRDAVASVGSPDYTYKAMTEWLVKNMKYSGKYMVVTNTGWHPLDERELHAFSVMKKYKRIKNIKDGAFSVGLHDPLNDNYEVIKQAIKANPDIKGIIATWGIPVVSAAKAVIDAGKSEQISIVGCDADMPILSLMVKKNTPKVAIMGWKAEEMSKIASELMDKSFMYGSTKEAKLNIGQVYRTNPFFVTNTGGDKVFEPFGAKTPDQAWDYVHKTRKKPWR